MADSHLAGTPETAKPVPTDPRPSRRVIYVALGEFYIRETIDSINTLWQHNPSLPVTLYTDREGQKLLTQVANQTVSDKIEARQHPRPTTTFQDKIVAIQDCDSEQVLYLDSDTWICGSIEEIFHLLDLFDVAASHDAIRVDPKQPQELARNIPISFPEFQAGVIALRKHPTGLKLLEDWYLLHQDLIRTTGNDNVSDQVPLRVALYNSDARIAVLPPEFDCHFPFPHYLDGPARILHGRWPHHPATMERVINRNLGPRAFVPGLGILTTAPRLIRRRRRYYRWREQGTRKMLSRKAKRFLRGFHA